jgi:hypothetical protein
MLSAEQKHPYQIIAKQQDTLVLSWNGEHQERPCCGQQAHASNGEPFSLEASGDPTGSNNDNDLDDAKRDVEEDGLKAGVPEVSDDETAKR